MRRKKALFMYEMYRTKWFMIVGCLLALVGVYFVSALVRSELWVGSDLIDSVYDTINMQGTTGSVFSAYLVILLKKAVIVAIPGFAFMSAMQFGDNQKRGPREFIESLPYTAGEKMRMKLVCGYWSITLACIVFSIGVLIFRSQIIERLIKFNVVIIYFEEVMANETLEHTIRILVFFWLTLLGMYSVYVLAQVVVHRTVLASLVGAGTILAPLEIYCFTYGIYHMFRENIYGMASYVARSLEADNPLRRVAGIFFGDLIGTPRDVYAQIYDNHYSNMIFVSYDNRWLVVGCLIAVVVLCTCIAYIYYGRHDLAKSHMVVSNKVARYVISVGCGVCFGTTIPAFFSDITNPWVYIAVSVVLTVLICAVCTKVATRTDR